MASHISLQPLTVFAFALFNQRFIPDVFVTVLAVEHCSEKQTSTID
jgi:hypothetical protein